MSTLTKQQVYEAITHERNFQDLKFGVDKQQSIAGYLQILRSELGEAERGWIKNVQGRDSVLSEILQIAAVAVGCLEKYGIMGSATTTDDIPQSK